MEQGAAHSGKLGGVRWTLLISTLYSTLPQNEIKVSLFPYNICFHLICPSPKHKHIELLDEVLSPWFSTVQRIVGPTIPLLTVSLSRSHQLPTGIFLRTQFNLSNSNSNLLVILQKKCNAKM